MNLIDKLLSVDKEELTKECTKTYQSQRKKAERTCIKYIGQERKLTPGKCT